MGNVVDQVVDTVKNGGTQAAGNIFSWLLGAPVRLVTGAFKGIFPGSLLFGGLFFLLQKTNMLAPIAHALGADDLLAKVMSASSNPLVNSLMMGAATSVATSATQSAVMGDKDSGPLGTVVGLGLVAGAVFLATHKDNLVKLAEGGDSSRPDATPGTPKATKAAAV